MFPSLVFYVVTVILISIENTLLNITNCYYPKGSPKKLSSDKFDELNPPVTFTCIFDPK